MSGDGLDFETRYGLTVAELLEAARSVEVVQERAENVRIGRQMASVSAMSYASAFGRLGSAVTAVLNGDESIEDLRRGYARAVVVAMSPRRHRELLAAETVAS